MPGISPGKRFPAPVYHRRVLGNELLLRAVTGTSFFTIRDVTGKERLARTRPVNVSTGYMYKKESEALRSDLDSLFEELDRGVLEQVEPPRLKATQSDNPYRARLREVLLSTCTDYPAGLIPRSWRP